MSEMKKIKRVSSILFGMVSVVLLHFIVRNVMDTVQMVNVPPPLGFEITWNVPVALSQIVPMLIMAVSLAMSLLLLHAIRKEESPFHLANVKRLKVIAALLIVTEPLGFIAERIFNRYNAIVIGANELGEILLVVHTRLNGGAITTGLIIYCIALVFQYGIALQTQVDETL